MNAPLPLADYRKHIHLDEPYERAIGAHPGIDPYTLEPIATTYPSVAYSSANQVCIWKGDITTLATDAIVNAANAGLQGCAIDNHPCIDWAIHHKAGPQVLADCQTIITLQGGPEVTGQAKITRAYELPSRFILHTVGPIVHGALTDAHETALASCYQSCLDLVQAVGGISTVAFCAISTGVFGYPKASAAHVALASVDKWLRAHPGVIDRVIIDVFSDEDLAYYEAALGQWPNQGARELY